MPRFFGIVFSLGTFTPAFPLGRLGRPGGDAACRVGPGLARRLALGDPHAANADVFVDRLVRRGLVVRDPIVAESCRRTSARVSTRTLQRRVARATGLTRTTIRQIKERGGQSSARARHARPRRGLCASATPTRPI